MKELQTDEYGNKFVSLSPTELAIIAASGNAIRTIISQIPKSDDMTQDEHEARSAYAVGMMAVEIGIAIVRAESEEQIAEALMSLGDNVTSGTPEHRELVSTMTRIIDAISDGDLESLIDPELQAIAVVALGVLQPQIAHYAGLQGMMPPGSGMTPN